MAHKLVPVTKSEIRGIRDDLQVLTVLYKNVDHLLKNETVLVTRYQGARAGIVKLSKLGTEICRKLGYL